MEDHRKTMENHRRLMEHDGIMSGKGLQKTMERFTMFHGKTHYFDWAIFNSDVKLPEVKHF